MSRPKLHQDARKMNLTGPLETKRKLCALGFDKGVSMSQVVVELVNSAPEPSRESRRRAEVEVV